MGNKTRDANKSHSELVITGCGFGGQRSDPRSGDCGLYSWKGEELHKGLLLDSTELHLGRDSRQL